MFLEDSIFDAGLKELVDKSLKLVKVDRVDEDSVGAVIRQVRN